MRSCANRLQESGVILCSTLYNRPFARWRHFTSITRILQGFAFLCKLGLFLIQNSLGLSNLTMKEETKWILLLVVKKKSSCKWPIMKKMHSPLFRWVGVSGNIQGSGCLPFSKGSRKSSWKANGTRLFGSFQQKKISGGNGTSEKLVVFFRTE